MAKKKEPVIDIKFYADKISTYFSQLEKIDCISVRDTMLRHGHLKQQTNIMDGLVAILNMIHAHLPRDKRGYYSELYSFERYFKYFKKYVTDFNAAEIELDQYQQQEANMQLELMKKIAVWEDFLHKQKITPEQKKDKEEETIEVAGDVDLSLADLKLIGALSNVEEESKAH